MIIRQTTTIIFEYPQDYLQEQEWCKTKEDRWIHKGTDTLGAVYENQISYSIGATADRKTEPSNSEKPNNCEVKNYCDDCLYTDTCDSKELFYACTSKATISKMEQVDEPQTCSVNGRPYDCGNCEHFRCTADEPQTEREDE